jgi:anaerobic ribonucleoside-triphosphate reductase activating protein
VVIRAAARLVSEAEGPGLRWALWVQGCPLRCDGCCNPELLDATGGEPVPSDRLTAELAAAREAFPAIEGVTFLGGEPFAQGLALARLARWARADGLSIVTYSGFTLEELRARPGDGARALLAATDLLVDGRWDPDAGPSPHRNVGSANQRLVPLTPRGAALATRWDDGPEVVEVRIDGTRVLANGVPGALDGIAARRG